MRVDAILFACDGHDYGVDVASVLEVVQIDHISPVPLAPAVVVGAVGLGGKVLPVLDVALITGLEGQPSMSLASGLRVRAGKHEVLLLASDMRGVRSIQLSESKEGRREGELAQEVSTSSGLVRLLDLEQVGDAVERLFDGVADGRGA